MVFRSCKTQRFPSGSKKSAKLASSLRAGSTCGVASNPSIYRGFVPNGTDLDAVFQQWNPRGLEVGHEKTTATKRAGERIPQPRAELDRATGAGRCKLNKAERIVWCVVDVNPKSDAIDVKRTAR